MAKRATALLLAVTVTVSHSQEGLLSKSHFDGRLRFVFVAGTERTGHHAWMQMFKGCADAGLCLQNDTLTELLGATIPDRKYQQASAWPPFVRFLREFRDDHRGQSNQLVVLNTMTELSHGKVYGMLSFPNGVYQAPLFHPNLFRLASAAEEAGIDLRILVLQRDARTMFDSIKTHVGRGAIGHNVGMLADNSLVLHGALTALDCRFYSCVNTYSLLNDTAAQDSVRGFLHPALTLDDLRTNMLARLDRGRLVRHSSRSSTDGAQYDLDEARTSVDNDDRSIRAFSPADESRVLELADSVRVLGGLCARRRQRERSRGVPCYSP